MTTFQVVFAVVVENMVGTKLRYIMVKHHILAVTLCTINRCKAVMGIGYSKFFWIY
jgi:hypothetical protein